MRRNGELMEGDCWRRGLRHHPQEPTEAVVGFKNSTFKDVDKIGLPAIHYIYRRGDI